MPAAPERLGDAEAPPALCVPPRAPTPVNPPPPFPQMPYPPPPPPAAVAKSVDAPCARIADLPPPDAKVPMYVSPMVEPPRPPPP